MNKIAMSYQSYWGKTGLGGKADKRGPSLKKVDAAFDDYEQRFPTQNEAGQIALTLELYKQSKIWLKKKEQKPATPDLLNRRKEVSELARQCLEELRAVQDISDAKARFDTRKVAMLAKGPLAVPRTPLSGGYINEQRSWDGSGKTQAFSGSLVHNTMPPKKNFDDLTPTQFQKLANLAGPQNQVLYFRKEARLAYMVDIDAQGRLCSMANGQTLTFGMPDFDPNLAKNFGWWRRFQDNAHMYAMDRYGNLFQSEELAGLSLGAAAQAAKTAQLAKTPNYPGQLLTAIKKFNHSSLNAGREVICAGIIGINKDGFLIWIDHNSGHYKPTREALLEAVTLLRDEHVDLSRTHVGVYDYAANGTINYIEVFSAQHFLNGGQLADICTI